MVSERNELRKDIQYKILVAIEKNANVSTRKISRDLGISNGAAYYCVKALIERGLVKFDNFTSSDNKRNYAYFLTPSGFLEKSVLTARFLSRKLKEYENIKKELVILLDKTDIEELDGEFNIRDIKL